MLEIEVETGTISLIPKCKSIKLSHFIFADDFMIFSKADELSITTIDGALRQFADLSGLQVNRTKSTQIFTGISI